MEISLMKAGDVDPVEMSILRETHPHPHSLEYLSKKLNLPPSRIKKKITELLNKGLLQEEMRVYNHQGSWVSFYRARVSLSSLQE